VIKHPKSVVCNRILGVCGAAKIDSPRPLSNLTLNRYGRFTRKSSRQAYSVPRPIGCETSLKTPMARMDQPP
jgi:hypothetical protein